MGQSHLSSSILEQSFLDDSHFKLNYEIRMQIVDLDQFTLAEIKAYTDKNIGEGYYSLDELKNILRKSKKNNVMCSLALMSEERQLFGVRLTYAPGNWDHGKGRGLKPELWPHLINETAYFQSLFLDSSLQGHGYGAQISLASIEKLKSIGARGIVCHSWKESPNDSSGKYLRKLGFQLIATHLGYWSDVDYVCTRCGKPPCKCTAEEMYLSL